MWKVIAELLWFCVIRSVKVPPTKGIYLYDWFKQSPSQKTCAGPIATWSNAFSRAWRPLRVSSYQVYQTDRFGGISIFIYSLMKCHLDLPLCEKINACCFRRDENVVLDTKKKPARIFGKATSVPTSFPGSLLGTRLHQFVNSVRPSP